MAMPAAPLRLTIDTAALAGNWRRLQRQAGAAACGAAIKADGYGLGASRVMATLAAAGCRDFLVANWAEAAALGEMPPGVRLAVLHGIAAGEEALAQGPTVPVLNTPAQVARWRSVADGRACDIMVDTGMNRLGLSLADATSGLLDGLRIDTLHSHLACADERDHPMNAAQLARFREAVAVVPHARASLANSAGMWLGADYAFGLTRPGIALYGWVAYPEARQQLTPVVRIAARVVQVREVAAGEVFGYGATWTATRPTRLAIANLGYADGYRRAFSGTGSAIFEGQRCPVVGRVSMDLTGFDIGASAVGEGDWLDIDFDLDVAAAATGIAQYELLTGLGHRYQRRYI
jgi:alanine racemase